MLCLLFLTCTFVVFSSHETRIVHSVPTASARTLDVSSVLDSPLTPLEIFERRINAAKQRLILKSDANPRSLAENRISRSRGRSKSLPDIRTYSPLSPGFDAHSMQSRAIKRSRERQAVAHLVTEQLAKQRRKEPNSEAPTAMHHIPRPIIPIPLDPLLLFPKPAPIRGGSRIPRTLSPSDPSEDQTEVSASAMTLSGTESRSLIQSISKLLLPKLRNKNGSFNIHTVSSTSTSSSSTDTGDERIDSPSPRWQQSGLVHPRDPRFEQFEALRLSHYQSQETKVPPRGTLAGTLVSQDRLPELRGLDVGGTERLPHRVSRTGNSQPSSAVRSATVSRDQQKYSEPKYPEPKYPEPKYPEAQSRKKYNYDLTTPHHQEEFLFPPGLSSGLEQLALNRLRREQSLAMTPSVVSRISTSTMSPPTLSPREDLSSLQNSSDNMEHLRERQQAMAIQRDETLHALMVDYWWVIAIIASVIFILLVVSCSLLIKQYRFGNEQKREQMKKVIINREHSKWSEEMQRQRISRIYRNYPSNRRPPRSLNRSHNVYIERTKSQQAPCKMYMVCHNIGRGRFGDVRLAIDPQVPSPPTSENRISPQPSPSNSMWPSVTREGIDYQVSTINNIELHSPRYYALKRARFSERGNGHNAEVWSIFHEIMILSQLQHPGIVKYHGNGVANNHIQLFLEWCPIGSMADILAIRKSFGIPQIRLYLVQLLNALKYLHSKHIYHRDVKSRNILLCADGGCKLADFGSAVDVSNESHRSDRGNRTKSSNMSSTGKHSVPSAGTVHWWPPETCCHSEEDYGVLSGHDVWNLGVTTIEMICGVPPFHNLPVQNFMMMMRATPKQYVEEIPMTSNAHLNSFVTACVTVEHHKRPSIRELLKHKFITSDIKQKREDFAMESCSASPVPSMELLLKEKQSHARRYAKSIVNANLSLWFQAMDSGLDRTDFSVSRTCTVSEPERSFAVNEQMIMQQHGVNPDAYRRSAVREYHHFHARNL